MYTIIIRTITAHAKYNALQLVFYTYGLNKIVTIKHAHPNPENCRAFWKIP